MSVYSATEPHSYSVPSIQRSASLLFLRDEVTLQKNIHPAMINANVVFAHEVRLHKNTDPLLQDDHQRTMVCAECRSSRLFRLELVNEYMKSAIRTLIQENDNPLFIDVKSYLTKPEDGAFSVLRRSKLASSSLSSNSCIWNEFKEEIRLILAIFFGLNPVILPQSM